MTDDTDVSLGGDKQTTNYTMLFKIREHRFYKFLKIIYFIMKSYQ